MAPTLAPDTTFRPAPKAVAKKKCILVDLDGTLNIFDQSEYNRNFDWKRTDCPRHAKEARRMMREHKPFMEMIALVNLLYCAMPANCVLLIVTARPELYRDVTEEWLLRYKVGFHDVLMRFNGDERKDSEVKRDILSKIRERFEPWFVIEDRASVSKMWREEGVLCLQCAEGNY